MVVLAVHLYQSGVVVLTYLGDGDLQEISMDGREDIAAVFGDKDQMDMKRKNATPTPAIIYVLIHRPSILCDMDTIVAIDSMDREVERNRARKRPKNAPTHVVSLPLRVTPRQAKTVEARFHTSTRVYNAALAESLDRCSRMHDDPRYAVAKSSANGEPRSKERAARNQAFFLLREEYGFTKSAIMSYGSSLRQSYVREQSLAQESQSVPAQAFRAVEDWHFKKRGKPRFKSERRGVHSVATKSPEGSMKPVWDANRNLVGVQWGQGMVLRIAHPAGHSQKKTEIANAERNRINDLVLSGQALSWRIVRTKINGRWTYRAQITVNGYAPIRTKVGTENVRIDLGPSSAHVVSDTTAFHEPLAPGATHQSRLLRTAQRHLDRQHRAGSPECFDAKGRHAKGACHWRSRSKSARRTANQITDLHRVLAARRLNEHGQLINKILAVGPHLGAEKLNYVGWQKMFPRSVRDRAPGAFVEHARYKAESASGGWIDINPWTTALSQHCVCGMKQKKPLSQRVHRCSVCGLVADRDLLSAYLALFVEPVDVETGELKDTVNFAMARAQLTPPRRQDIGAVPEVGGAVVRDKQRGSRRRPPGRRSMSRITARRQRTLHSRPTELLGTIPTTAFTSLATTISVKPESGSATPTASMSSRTSTRQRG